MPASLTKPTAANLFSTESVLEVTYSLQLAPWWQLQPDFQYYLKPSAGIHTANAAVLGLRTTITF